jgi:hypothetical protein
MAGLYFGTSHWDNIPQTLGLSVVGGVMKGLWQGTPVQASFTNRYDQQRQQYYHFTCLRADLDPPLGLQGLEHGEAMKRVVDQRFQSDVEERAKNVGLHDLLIGDSSVYAEYGDYVSDPERYRVWFDTLTWAAKIIMDRRAKNPPEWERAIASAWPALAQAWSFRLDARRGLMAGNVGGRETSASVVVKEGEVMTFVHVATLLPPGCSLSLTRQKNGFWAKLFRGQDIIVGDPAFDAAFVIKGEPKEFVHAALTPSAREQIMELTHAGMSITLEHGRLAGWTNQLLTNREHLDALMKASCLAAEALCSPKVPLASPTP